MPRWPKDDSPIIPSTRTTRRKSGRKPGRPKGSGKKATTHDPNPDPGQDPTYTTPADDVDDGTTKGSTVRDQNTSSSSHDRIGGARVYVWEEDTTPLRDLLRDAAKTDTPRSLSRRLIAMEDSIDDVALAVDELTDKVDQILARL